MHFFSKKNQVRQNLTLDQQQDEQKRIQDFQQPVIKKTFKKRIIQLSAGFLMLLQLVGCNSIPVDSTGPSVGPSISDTENPPVVQQQSITQQISNEVIKNTFLSKFEYQFFTTERIEGQPCIVLNGTFEKNGQKQAASVVYSTTEEIYDWFEEFDTTVTAQNGSFSFGNDYYVFEDRKSDIMSYVLGLAEGSPLSVQEMTLEQQKDYVIKNNFEREHNFELSNMNYINAGDRIIYYTCYGYALKEQTEDGRYVFVKVKYQAELHYKAEDQMYNPDGSIKFIPERMIFKPKDCIDETLSIDQILTILSYIGENENNPIVRSAAASKFPGSLSYLISTRNIGNDATEYKDITRNN